MGSFSSFNYCSSSPPPPLLLLFLDCIRNPGVKGTLDSCTWFSLAHQLWLLNHSPSTSGHPQWYHMYKTYICEVEALEALELHSLLVAKVPSMQLKLWEVSCGNVESTLTSTPSQIFLLRHGTLSEEKTSCLLTPLSPDLSFMSKHWVFRGYMLPLKCLSLGLFPWEHWSKSNFKQFTPGSTTPPHYNPHLYAQKSLNPKTHARIRVWNLATNTKKAINKSFKDCNFNIVIFFFPSSVFCTCITKLRLWCMS